MSASGGSTAPLYASMFVSAASSVSAGISKYGAERAQGDYEQSVANANSKLAAIQSKEAIAAGDSAANIKGARVAQQAGTARASAAAGGVDVNSGSTAVAINNIKEIGEFDKLAIKNNAARTAWGYQTQSIMDTFRGKMAQLTARATSRQTLITGGLRALAGPSEIYGNYLRYTQRYDGKQASPSDPGYIDMGSRGDQTDQEWMP